MREELPIACSLSAADLADRTQAWGRLVDGWGTSREAIPNGVRLHFRAADGVQASLTQLVALEAECCPWMAMQLASGEDVVLTVTGPQGTSDELRRMFGLSTARG
jgi:hypothetical protein